MLSVIVGPFLLLAWHFILGTAAAEVQCFAPDGKTVAPNDTYVPCNKLGIDSAGIYSSCCRLDGDVGSRDVCAKSGLCISGNSSDLTRGYCTDSTWQSPACVNVCTDPESGGSADGAVEITSCIDNTNTYCCGKNNRSCCGTPQAIKISDEQDSIANINGTVVDPHSSTYKNATIGLGVATGVVLIGSAIAIFILLRKNKSVKQELNGKSSQPQQDPMPATPALAPYGHGHMQHSSQPPSTQTYNAQAHHNTIDNKTSYAASPPPVSMSPSPPPPQPSPYTHAYSELDGTAPVRSELGQGRN